MSDRYDLGTITAEVESTLSVIGKINAYYDDYIERSLIRHEPSRENKIVLAEILVNYYTALETLFLRISQAFENSLSSSRWHADLLDKMTLEIAGIRPRLLSDEARDNLRELMRFRHFKRYYLEFDYDWDKLLFLEKKYIALRELLPVEIEHFLDLLRTDEDAGT